MNTVNISSSQTKPKYSRRIYQLNVFLFTFLAYCALSLARLPYSISKSSLHPPPPETGGYPPFDSNNGKVYLGILDTTFLIVYSFGLLFNGGMGDKISVKWFIGIGMITAGVAVVFFGLAYPFGIHFLFYFILVNAIAGFGQSTGWPGCVAAMGVWFGEGSRGFIMGAWNAHQNVGNILGKLISTFCQHNYGWPSMFLVCGIILIVSGVLVILFLIEHPKEVSLYTIEELKLLGKNNDDDISNLNLVRSNVNNENNLIDDKKETQINFYNAITIPGVIPYSLCLFCSKFVAYCLVYWLPYYLNDVGLSRTASGVTSTLFDIGGFLGGVTIGYFSDRIGKRALMSVIYCFCAVFTLYFYFQASSLMPNSAISMILLVIVGAFVNGPYCLISSAVAADIASRPNIISKGKKAIATVTGIIDGTGSIGGAIQSVIVGYFAHQFGWGVVYYLLMIMSLFSAIMIIKLAWEDFLSLSFFNRNSETRYHSISDY